MIGKNGAILILTRRGYVLRTPRPIPTLEIEIDRLVSKNEVLQSRVADAQVTFSKLTEIVGAPASIPADVERVFQKRLAAKLAKLEKKKGQEVPEV